MTLKELFITGGYSKKYDAEIRPIWQIILLTIPGVVYFLASKYVNFMDRRF